MVLLYAARVADLHDGMRVEARCGACGHIASIEVSIIKQKLPPYAPVLEIRRRFRCMSCTRRGEVRIDAMAALWGPANAR